MGAPFKITELQQLQAKIVLLQALNDTPSQPSEKFLYKDLESLGAFPSRVLSLSREKELAENLAFIASTTDDPGKVLALAIEEENGGKGMNITLAVNNGGLDSVRNGLEEVAKVLQEICREGTATQSHQDDLLTSIISSNHNRILCRLRSKHAVLRCNFKKNKLDKPKTIPILTEAVREPSASGQQRVIVDPVQNRVTSHVDSLCRNFARLEKLKPGTVVAEQGRKLLVELVKTASELSCASAFPTILDRSKLDPCSRAFIANNIRKLGRYCTATRFLCQAASRFSIFGQIRISIIKLPATPLPAVSSPEALMETSIRRIVEIEGAQDATSKLMLRLKNRKIAYSQVCTAITTTRPVVHAEIQLLAHYEKQDIILPPRIICSSKKACFLCNLFLELHGKFIVPSTHGKLYEKWTLPATLSTLTGERSIAMQSILRSFNVALDERLKREILVADKRFPPPHESIVFGSAIWSELREPSPAPIERIDSGYDDGGKGHTVSSSTPTRSFIRSESTVHLETIVEPSLDELIPVPLHLVEAKSRYFALIKGQEKSFQLSLSCRVIKVSTPRIHLTLSHQDWEQSMASVSLDKISDEIAGCRLHFTWLEDYHPFDPDATIIDLDEAADDFKETLDQLAGSCDFCVKKGKDTVRIKTTYV